VNVPAGADYPYGLFVLQNGKAPAPADSSDIHGFEYDGSSQFMLLGWEQLAQALHLTITPHGFDPRRP
jgi:myo-inositol-hexaphosphate 3-phosphohydrolase